MAVKVLFLMSWSMEEEWQLWQTKKLSHLPTHYLWGTTQLDPSEIEVMIFPYEKFKFLKRFGDWLHLGDLEQQIRLCFSRSHYDVVYANNQRGSTLLAVLKCLGLFRKPLLVKLERPFGSSWLSHVALKIFARGHTKIICLSSRIQDQLKDEFGIPLEKIPLLDWGPDLAFYDRVSSGVTSEPKFFLSAGSTWRDYDTLVTGFLKINYPLEIYCSADSAPTRTDLPETIQVQFNQAKKGAALSFADLIQKYEKAYAVLIPLDVPQHRANTTNLIGLTSLLEAMAMGKAVVMTKHRQVNIDIEKEGIGLWVEPDDAAGWEKAITYLLEHPEETQKMGERSRYLCEAKYNLETYAAGLTEILKSTVSTQKGVYSAWEHS